MADRRTKDANRALQKAELRRKQREDWDKNSPMAKAATIGFLVCIVAGPIVLVVRSCSSPSQSDTSSQTVQPFRDAKPGQPCDGGGRVTQVDYAVQRAAKLIARPSTSATAVAWVHEDGSKSAVPISEGDTVREMCRSGSWSLVRLLSTTELSELQGWVAAADLKDVPRTRAAKRLYVASDFDWPPNTRSSRAAVVTIANRIMEQQPGCAAIDTKNLVLNRRTFSLPCFAGSNLVSFDFVAADATNGRSFAPVDPISRDEAGAACEAATLERASHPSTVDFDIVGDRFDDDGDGTTHFASTFTGKNGFNLELKYDVQCDFIGRRMTNLSMAESAS